jgi:hypothetical protein
MTTVTLHCTGDVDRQVWVTGGPTVTGSPPQWGDGSDATYAVLVDPPTAAAISALEPLTPPAGEVFVTARAQVRVKDPVLGAAFFSLWARNNSFFDIADFGCYFTNDLADLTDPITTFPADASIHTLDLVMCTEVNEEPIDLAVVEAAMVGGGFVEVSTRNIQTLTVYDFTVYADYVPALPPSAISGVTGARRTRFVSKKRS